MRNLDKKTNRILNLPQLLRKMLNADVAVSYFSVGINIPFDELTCAKSKKFDCKVTVHHNSPSSRKEEQ